MQVLYRVRLRKRQWGPYTDLRIVVDTVIAEVDPRKSGAALAVLITGTSLVPDTENVH